MINNYKVITSNHTLTDLSNLSIFMVEEGIPVSERLNDLKEAFNISEIMYLNTCNRVAYIFYTEEEVDWAYIEDFIRMSHGSMELDLDVFAESVSLYEGLEAINHVMEIAGSVDSLVVGEREIYRQFREAYQQGLAMGTVGDNIRLLEKKTVETAKSVYTNTRIGEKPLSIAALGLASITAFIKSLDAPTITLIGAGETNQLLAKLMKPKIKAQYQVINRGEGNGQKLAKFLHATFVLLEDAKTYRDLAPSDVIIVCTGSQSPILDLPLYHALRSNRSQHAILDLSVPANVSQEVIQNSSVQYTSIDQLKDLAAINLAARKREIGFAKEIIQQSMDEFCKTFEERRIELALAEVPKEIAEIKVKALTKVFNHRIATLPPDTQALIQEMMEYMEKKCISIPIKTAKKRLL